MKRIVMIAMIAASVSAFAYTGPRESMRPMFEALELTPAQKSELAVIRKESRAERLKLMDAMQELRAKRSERMMAVLSKKQQAQFKAMRRSMFERRASRNCDCPKMPMRRTRCETR